MQHTQPEGRLGFEIHSATCPTLPDNALTPFSPRNCFALLLGYIAPPTVGEFKLLLFMMPKRIGIVMDSLESINPK